MTQLKDIDLNLLVVLDALLDTQSVTRAADRLDLTPSAVSHSLKRVRNLLDDELLVRDGRKMRLTVRAAALAETLPRLLSQIESTIEPPEPFDPATSTRRFLVAAPDFIAPLVPSLLRDIHAKAPGVRVELAPYSTSAIRELADGHYDALVSTAAARNEDLRSTPLGSWPWAVYARAGHPAFDDWSVSAWSTHPHLQVRPRAIEGKGPTDQRADELGIDRVVQAVVPHFSMAAPVLAQTDLLLTAPSVAMGDAAAAYNLDRRDVPFDLPPMGLSLFRNATDGNEPSVRWFLERAAAAFGAPGREPQERHQDAS